MNASTLIAVRAHVVLLSVSICIVSVPCLAISEASGALADTGSQWPWQAVTCATAMVVMMLIRALAHTAFRRAFRAGKLERRRSPEHAVQIAGDCRLAWLVQLHLELRGMRCVD
ncbi:hypothetical protein LFL96_35900 (plasmid) [Paraburkholderia sp. D15]|uniref:hypothetical protein n=1 Tax=Paraburkholderia sp. D15 TaxID=2880218 RepID=UPI00247910EB|nr:hypothetical protein [Paraburkholderia sp. D15]WGS54887.1 hypothetical protein LFL96_35900 [Paraburkholderia sp. D15]